MAQLKYHSLSAVPNGLFNISPEVIIRDYKQTVWTEGCLTKLHKKASISVCLTTY
jgi:hypothetical protein